VGWPCYFLAPRPADIKPLPRKIDGQRIVLQQPGTNDGGRSAIEMKIAEDIDVGDQHRLVCEDPPSQPESEAFDKDHRFHGAQRIRNFCGTPSRGKLVRFRPSCSAAFQLRIVMPEPMSSRLVTETPLTLARISQRLAAAPFTARRVSDSDARSGTRPPPRRPASTA